MEIEKTGPGALDLGIVWKPVPRGGGGGVTDRSQRKNLNVGVCAGVLVDVCGGMD